MSGGLLRVEVPDVFALNHEDNRFGDIGRVVRDSFNAFANGLLASCCFCPLRIAHHLCDKLRKELRIEGVHHGIALLDGFRFAHVARNERI